MHVCARTCIRVRLQVVAHVHVHACVDAHVYMRPVVQLAGMYKVMYAQKSLYD